MTNKIDTSGIDKIIENLSGAEIKKAQKDALRESAKILQKKAKENLSSSGIKGVRHKGHKWSRGGVHGKYSDSLLDAIRVSVDKNMNEDTIEAKVHIMGTRKKGSGTFRTKFFEKGTVHGIKGTGFFASAKSQSESLIMSSLEDNLIKSLEKIINK